MSNPGKPSTPVGQQIGGGGSQGGSQTPQTNPNAQQVLSFLQSPIKSLPAFGQVHDQRTGQFVKYDPYRLTKTLQAEILEYLSNPPLTNAGQAKFLTVLTARQMGKSLTSEYGCYPKAAFTPGHDHVCIADTKDRAEYLHKRVHHLHERWPSKVRSRQIPNREARQLTFRPMEGGKMRVLSAETGAVGIGQSPDTFHASECAFWADFAGSMFLIWPSLMNRDHALAIFECTPWEARSDWHNHCLEAKNGVGRHTYLFKPFWDGHLNARPWDKDWQLTNQEIDLMNQYGPDGLQLENLAFRRLIMETDVKIRRHPEFFRVFYPFDDVSCWLASAQSAIPSHVLERHQNKKLVPWRGPYQEYEQPDPNAYYVMGVDPCGHAARDHASFQILKCYDGEWTQVATYAEHSDPIIFTKEIVRAAKKYNNALVVVESNGVGQSVLALLRDWEYSNVFYEKLKRPGFTTTAKSLGQCMGWLTDALMDELELNDENTVEQLLSYRNDKIIEENVASEIARGQASNRRRERHHWDKVSALSMAIVGARWAPRRQKMSAEKRKVDQNVVLFPTWDSWNAYQEAEKTQKSRRPSLRKSHGSWYRKGPKWK